MARVTVEDCINKIHNRFELILIAAERSRALANGNEATVERDNDKNPVVALREIASGTIDIEKTSHELVRGLQKFHEDKIEDEESDSNLDNIKTETEALIVNDAEENADAAGMQIHDAETE